MQNQRLNIKANLRKELLKVLFLLFSAFCLLLQNPALASPELSVKTLLPAVSPSSIRQCKDLFQSPSIGVAVTSPGQPMGANGRHYEVRETRTYQIGGFNFLSMGRQVTDSYVSGHEWRPHFYLKSADSKESPYRKVLDDFLEFWKQKEVDPERVEIVDLAESQSHWWRSTFFTYSINETYIGGMRLFDGQQKINFRKRDGDIAYNVKLDLTHSEVKLPMEMKHPELQIPGRKIEIGLLTSRTEVDNSLPALLATAARHIVELYGAGKYEVTDSRIPLWIESKETGTVNIGGSNSVSQVYRNGLAVDYSKTIQYMRAQPDPQRSLRELDDLYIYFTANPRITKLHERNIAGVERIEQVSLEDGGIMNVLRVQASTFVDQFYFSNTEANPQLNQAAQKLKSYREADIIERKQKVQEARRKRMYREAQLKALREAEGPDAKLEEWIVNIRGDYMRPGAGLEISISPNPQTNWREYRKLFAPGAHELLERSFREFDEVSDAPSKKDGLK